MRWQLFARFAIPVLLAIGVPLASDAAEDCDRECLRGAMTQYLAALVAHKPATLAVAPAMKFTENGVEMKLGEGLWKTASRLTPYRLDFLDVPQGVAGSHVVLDEEGAIAFNAMDTDERWLQPSDPGNYVATAWIPGNLLNEGSAIVEAAICSIDFPKLEHHAAVYEDVWFEVLDPGEGDSARGQFSGQWRGVVRPLLDWTVR